MKSLNFRLVCIVVVFTAILLTLPIPQITVESKTSVALAQPTINTISDPNTQAVELAKDFIVDRTGIKREDIAFVRRERAHFQSLNATLDSITLLIDASPSPHIYKVLVNVNEQTASDDYQGWYDLERQAHEAKYGKLSVALYHLLETISDNTVITVGIWATANDQTSHSSLQASTFNRLAKSYPQTLNSMAKYGNPFDLGDKNLSNKLLKEYDQEINYAMKMRTLPIENELIKQEYSFQVFEGMPLIIADLPKSAILQFNRLSSISSIDRANGTEILELDSALNEHLAAIVWGQGFDVTGVTIGIVDPGNIDSDNSYLNIASTSLTGPDGETFHATQAASAAASFHSTYSGVAKDATVLSASTQGTISGAIFALRWSVGNSFQNAPIANYSAGFEEASNELQQIDRAWDYWARNFGVLLTKSSGNIGHLSGEITSPGKGWNVLTVGAYNDSTNSIWNKSSFVNPCGLPGDCEGREKPEVVAVGADITLVSINDTLNNVDGTSFAAPQVAGLAALLIDRHSSLELWAEASRAIIMAAATQNIEGPTSILSGQGDLKDGAGAINAKQASDIAAIRGNSSTACSSSCWWGTGTSSIRLGGALTQQFFANAGTHNRIAISWWSNADSDTGGYSYDRLDTDLDLTVSYWTGTSWTLVPNAVSASEDNNYEIVEFVAPATTNYLISVIKTNTFNNETINFVGIAALINYTNCEPDMNIEIINGDDVRISWGNTGSYRVWRDENAPYFRPWDGGTIFTSTGNSSWIHSNGAGNPSLNNFYIVENLNGDASLSVCQAVGEFDFSIVPGS